MTNAAERRIVRSSHHSPRGAASPQSPRRVTNCGTEVARMSETEHEHDDDDDADEPISIETAVDDDTAEADVEQAEREEAEHESDVEHEHVEHDDDADADAGEQEAAAPQIDQKAIDKLFDALDREASRHAKRLGEILGEDGQDLDLCPTCGPVEGFPNVPGFVLAGLIPPEAAARMKFALGINDTENLKPAPHVQPCETCNALGMVATGSHVPGQEAIMCPACSQKGYVLTGAPAPALALVTQPNGVEGAAEHVPQAIGPEPPEAAALRARGYAVIPPPTSG